MRSAARTFQASHHAMCPLPETPKIMGSSVSSCSEYALPSGCHWMELLQMSRSIAYVYMPVILLCLSVRPSVPSSLLPSHPVSVDWLAGRRSGWRSGEKAGWLAGWPSVCLAFSLACTLAGIASLSVYQHPHSLAFKRTAMQV